MIWRLLLSQQHWESMRAHVDACAPNEGCGLLAGTGEQVTSVLPLTNRERSPTRFRLDAAEQLRAFRLLDERHLDLIGIFHSHPAEAADVASMPSVPSATDIAEAAYPVVHVIWSRRHGVWSAAGFWIEDGKVISVMLQITSRQ